MSKQNDMGGKVKPKSTTTYSPTKPRSWGSIRAAEYGIPQLAIHESYIPTATSENDIVNTPNNTGGAGGAGSNPYSNLVKAISDMYGKASGQINDSMTNLNTFLAGQKNPYEGFKAQDVVATPALEELLKSQGVSTTPLQQLATVVQAQNTGQTGAYNNLMDSMKTMWDAGQVQQQQNANIIQQQALQALAGNAMGYGAGALADKKKVINQAAIMQLIKALSGGK
jgi:hypothetical protein